MFSNQQNMETLVNDLTKKVRARFEVSLPFAFLLSSMDVYSFQPYHVFSFRLRHLMRLNNPRPELPKYFFGPNSDFFRDDHVRSALQRIQEMTKVAAKLANEPFSVSDPKYGIHGGLRNQPTPVSNEDFMASGVQVPLPASARTLFYCGGAHGHLQGRANFKYSTFGLFLAKSLFPEFKGDIEIIQPGDQVENTATPLTEDTIKSATEADLLIVHSHQHCDVSVDAFPGTQLHINVRRALHYYIFFRFLDGCVNCFVVLLSCAG
jgi:hypothetical protein